MDNGKLTAAEWHHRFMQQTAWTNNLRNYLFNRISLKSNPRILEVGCGTCAVLSQIHNENYRKFGIDIDIEFLKFGLTNFSYLHLVHGNGLSLPFPSQIFDLVFCHYLLLWVDNPIRILQEIARVGKPGSKVIILAEPDYGGRIDYPPPLQQLGKAQIEGLQRQGADPFIGRKIRELTISARMTILEHGVLNSQSEMGIDQEFIDSEWQMLENDLSNQLSNNDIQHFKQIDLEAWKHGIRVLFVPIFYLLAEIRES